MIVTPINHPISSENIFGAVPETGVNILDWPLLTSLVPTRAVGSPVFTRATAAMFVDHESKYWQVLSGEARFSGARRVENFITYSEDLSHADWHLGGTATVTGFDILNLPAEFDFIRQAPTLVPVGHRFGFSVKLSGSGTVSIRLGSGGSDYTTVMITLSATPKRYVVFHDFTNPTFFPTITRNFGNTATLITVEEPQVELVANDETVPSEYISNGVLSDPYHGVGVDGVKYFDTQNGNTVIDNVVTEVIGAAISDLVGLLMEPASTNKVECYSTPGADQLGSELWSDPADSLGTGWTHDGDGVYSCDGSQVSTTALTMVLTVILGTKQSWSFEVLSASGGSVGMQSGDLSTGSHTTPGTYSIEGIVTVGAGNMNVTASVGFIGSIQLISHKEIGGTDSDTGAFKSGLGIDTQAFHDGSVFQNPIPGMTLAGDIVSVLSVVDDQTALELFGELDLIVGHWKVYKLDNSLGVSASFATIEGQHANINTHKLSVFARVIGGVTSDLRTTYSDGITVLDGGTVFNRYSSGEYVPTNANAELRMRSVAGDVIYFAIPQLEEAPIVSSPILTNGSSVTRNKDELSIQIEDNFGQAEGTMFIDWTPHYDSSILSVGEGIVALRAGFASILYLDTGSSGKLTSTDATNYHEQTTSFLKDVVQKIAIAWGSSLSITRNGITGTPNPYDGAFTVDGSNFISFGQASKSPFSVANFKIYSVQKHQFLMEDKTS